MTALPRTDAEPHPWGPRDGKGGRAHPVPFALPRGSPCSPRRLPNGPRVKILRAGPWDRLSLPPAFRVSRLSSLHGRRKQPCILGALQMHSQVPAAATSGPCSCILRSLRLQPRVRAAASSGPCSCNLRSLRPQPRVPAAAALCRGTKATRLMEPGDRRESGACVQTREAVGDGSRVRWTRPPHPDTLPIPRAPG